MNNYGFLFGAGAELGYNLPSGGRFALDIFRQDTSKSKDLFRKMRDEVDPTTAYAGHWLPADYKSRNIGCFGKNVFQNIIKSTVEHRREGIVNKVNDIDSVALKVVKGMEKEGLIVDEAIESLLSRKISNTHMSQVVAYNDALQKGNKLFDSNYFSALLLIYRDVKNKPERGLLKRIIIAIMQLQLGALAEDLTHNINDNLFVKKDDGIDLLDDFGDLITLNYSAAGESGLDFLLDYHDIDTTTSYGVILRFAQLLIEDIYASVLDYKSLIDSYWHYLYNPSSDWNKFCKIAVFLLTVNQYISEIGDKADKSNPDGYYNMFRKSLDDGQYQASAIATTNYNKIIEEILGPQYPVTYLNGSVSVWYDPYLNKVGSKSNLDNDEQHIIVPLIFTQSGTKPMTSISMSEKYVDIYRKWKESDAIVVVGFGFGADDEHINGILRTLVNDDGKTLKVVTLKRDRSEGEESRRIANAIKVSDHRKVEAFLVDKEGKIDGRPWTECIGGSHE